MIMATIPQFYEHTTNIEWSRYTGECYGISIQLNQIENGIREDDAWTDYYRLSSSQQDQSKCWCKGPVAEACGVWVLKEAGGADSLTGWGMRSQRRTDSRWGCSSAGPAGWGRNFSLYPGARRDAAGNDSQICHWKR